MSNIITTYIIFHYPCPNHTFLTLFFQNHNLVPSLLYTLKFPKFHNILTYIKSQVPFLSIHSKTLTLIHVHVILQLTQHFLITNHLLHHLRFNLHQIVFHLIFYLNSNTLTTSQSNNFQNQSLNKSNTFKNLASIQNYILHLFLYMPHTQNTL